MSHAGTSSWRLLLVLTALACSLALHLPSVTASRVPGAGSDDAADPALLVRTTTSSLPAGDRDVAEVGDIGGESAVMPVSGAEARGPGLRDTSITGAGALEAGAAAALAGQGVASDVAGGMEASLQLLRATGPVGQATALLLQLSGALATDYEVLDRTSYAPPQSPTRDERVASIIARYREGAFLIGLTGGALSLFPGGLLLSTAVESLGILAWHARMALDIAAAYGWDIRSGNDLFIVTMFLLSDSALGEPPTELTLTPSLHQITRAVARTLGITVSTALAVKLSTRLVVSFSRLLWNRSRTAILRAMARHTGAAVAERLFQTSTAGLAMLVSGLADQAITERVGVHLAIVARPWLVDLPLDGMPRLADREARDCFFATLGELVWSDGALSGREQRFFRALLDQPYHATPQGWFELDSAERRDHARALGARTPAQPGCITTHFGDLPTIPALNLLSQLHGAIHLEDGVAAAEQALYDDLRLQLTGPDELGRPRIEDYQVDFVERATRATLQPDGAEWIPEYATAIDRLAPEDMLPFLEEVSPVTEADFSCGLAGTC
jgi:hypothetical protein